MLLILRNKLTVWQAGLSRRPINLPSFTVFKLVLVTGTAVFLEFINIGLDFYLLINIVNNKENLFNHNTLYVIYTYI